MLACWFLTMCALDRAFMAQTIPVPWCRARLTRPKLPVPSTRPTSKSSRRHASRRRDCRQQHAARDINGAKAMQQTECAVCTSSVTHADTACQHTVLRLSGCYFPAPSKPVRTCSASPSRAVASLSDVSPGCWGSDGPCCVCCVCSLCCRASDCAGGPSPNAAASAAACAGPGARLARRRRVDPPLCTTKRSTRST